MQLCENANSVSVKTGAPVRTDTGICIVLHQLVSSALAGK